MKIIFLLMIICFIFLLFSCCTNKPLQLEIDSMEKNSVEYIFPFSKERIEDAIVKAFSIQHGGKPYCYGEQVYFGKKGRQAHSILFTHDALLYLETECSSKVYFQKNGFPYTYSPRRFQFHIELLEENLAKVWIEVVEPKVPIRPPLIPLPHVGWEYKEVPPTTVEEYEILQFIGKELGVTDMPEIKIPKKIVF